MVGEEVTVPIMPKHKRARRKKLQEHYQEELKADMILQLERRLQNQPSTSSVPNGSTVDRIPLPLAEAGWAGEMARLTEEDYKICFMKDPEVVSPHSSELFKSQRTVRKADDAERYIMARIGATANNVLHEFRARVLEPSREKRLEQIDIPRVEHPVHKKENSGTEEIQPKSTSSPVSPQSSSESSSDSDSSESDVSSEEERKDVRYRTRRKTRHERHEDKLRQVNLTRLSIERKKNHPNALHPDIPFNEKGLANENPECRCPHDTRNSGLRHGYYLGEDQAFDCVRDKTPLYSYTLRVMPFPSEKQVQATSMMINGDEFCFEGFSLVTHSPLPDCITRMPVCRYGVDYKFQLIEEPIPNGCFYAEDAVDLYEYLFHEVFELLDFNLRPKHIEEGVKSCPVIHIMPRFVLFKSGIIHLWSTKAVLGYFLMKSGSDMFSPGEILNLCRLDEDAFFHQTSKLKQSIVLNSHFKPSAIRADSFERDVQRQEIYFIYNAIRYNAFSTVSLTKLNRLERRLEKLQRAQQTHGVRDSECESVIQEIQNIRQQHQTNRNLKLRQRVTGYTNTGVKPDMVAHVVMAILACHHVRYNFSLSVFERLIEYQFNDRRVIELAMTHPSQKTYYGTTTDHVKNLIVNCGYRRKYGTEDKRERKKGNVTLYTIMTGQASTEPILHNERLEYLGDAVVELMISHHLFFMLPHHYEGGLATYRTALVQNRNLAKLALRCRVDEILQYAHGAELCHEAEWKHALANAFEALMAAVYLDGGIVACDKIFSKAMYGDQPELKKVWDHINEHELKREDPLGDRELSHITPTLSSFHELEEMTGIQFNNIRLLAKAFTRRNVPPNDLTKGHNQRLEWLGDSVLQLIVSDYLYKNFPLHHEGHMSLLRTSLVSNQTQSVVCDDLGLQKFVIRPPYKVTQLKMKDKADLVEAFIGALYVDQGIEHCRSFVRVVFCPRLRHFIDNEKWNDAKSHLQQWCLLDRDESNPVPEMPEYRMLSSEGPTNSRVYRVAVYFRGRRLACAEASNVHQAELKAAEIALSGVDVSRISDMRDKKRSRRHRGRRCVIDTNYETV